MIYALCSIALKVDLFWMNKFVYLLKIINHGYIILLLSTPEGTTLL